MAVGNSPNGCQLQRVTEREREDTSVEELSQAVANLDGSRFWSLVQNALENGGSPLELLSAAREGMTQVRSASRAESTSSPISWRVGQLFKEVSALVSGNLGSGGSGEPKAKVIIATVKSVISTYRQGYRGERAPRGERRRRRPRSRCLSREGSPSRQRDRGENRGPLRVAHDRFQPE